MAKLTKKTWAKPNTNRNIPNWKRKARARAAMKAKWRARV